jgi:DNA ligase (NAD+)
MSNLKAEVIEAFIAHETGRPLKYTNSQYDEMLEQVKSEDPNFNPFEFLPIPEGSSSAEHRSGIIALDKYSPEGNDIAQYWNDEEGKVKTPKYDGSDIIIYYTNGKLSHILSMGDKEIGVVQTDKFKEFVPDVVDKSISFIRAECLVDVRDYEGARGKANGLVNSCYKQDEVNELAILVGLHAVDINGEILTYKDFNNKVPSFVFNQILNRTTFFITPECKDIELVERGIAHYKDVERQIDLKFCIDGIVYTEDKDWDSVWCYKYDYLYPAETYVEDIQWRETPTGGLVSVLSVDEVELDNKTIRNVSTNGVPKLLELGCGVGSKIEVAFSGMTIPKVVNVLEPAEVVLPKCECGHQFTEDDIVSAQLVCPDPKCSYRLKKKRELMQSYLDAKQYNEYQNLTDSEYVMAWFEWFIFAILNIPRFNYEKKSLVPFESISSELLQLIKDEKVDDFNMKIWNSYKMSDLNWDDLVRNSYATIKVIKDYLE